MSKFAANLLGGILVSCVLTVLTVGAWGVVGNLLWHHNKFAFPLIVPALAIFATIEDAVFDAKYVS